jgi:SAM-dependent methyltransferase
MTTHLTARLSWHMDGWNGRVCQPADNEAPRSYVSMRRRRWLSASIVSLEIKPMAWGRQLLMRMFGRPKGIVGRLGGMIMARVNRDAAAQVIELLDVRSDDKVLEVGFGPGVAIQLLLQRLPTGSVAGVDQSQEMVSQAAARNADALRTQPQGRPALRLSGTAAVRRPDVRQGTRDQFDAGVAGYARWTAGDMARAQAWWHRGTRLHCQLRSAKAWRCGVARRCRLCAGANRG